MAIFRRRGHGESVVAPAKSDRLTPDGLRITEFPAAILSLLRLGDGIGATAGQVFATQQNVRTVVDLISREAAELSAKMYERVPRTGDIPSGRLELDDHPMVQLLDEPNPEEPTYDFWYATYADLCIYDRVIWRKVYDGGGPPKALIRVPPARLLPVRDPITLEIVEWRDARGQKVNPAELFVVFGYDPETNHSSISPMETLRRLLSDDVGRDQARRQMLVNALRRDGIIEQAPEAQKLTDEAAESFLLDMQESLSGTVGTGRPALLLPGMSWKESRWTDDSGDYIKARELTRTEVATAFHVPPAMVAAAANAQQPSESDLEYFYTSTLPPMLSRVEDNVKAKLLPEFTPSADVRRKQYISFNLDAKLRGQFEKKAAIMATTAGGPVITVNEGRSRLDLPPIPGGDQIFIPMNLVRAGGTQVGPRNPVETPAQGIEPVGVTPGGGTQPQTASVVSGEDAEALIKGWLVEADEREAEIRRKANQEAFAREHRATYVERGTSVIQRTFERQKNVAQAGKPFDVKRWDRELADDLFGLAIQTVDAFGANAVKEIGGEWTTPPAGANLKRAAAEAAKQINSKTSAELGADEPDLDSIFGGERAAALANDRTTWAMHLALSEAAKQNS